MADITMPQLGETVTEGTITKWFKQVGEEVAEDEPLFEVSTDKVDSEVPSPSSGYLAEILVQEGDTVDVGTRLAVISDGPPGESGGDNGQGAQAEQTEQTEVPAEAPTESDAEPEPTEEPPAEASAQEGAEAPAETEEAEETRAQDQPRAAREPEGGDEARPPRDGGGDGKVLSPVVRRLLTEHDLDPSQIEGTGAGGRITRNDVLAVVEGGKPAARPAAPEREAEPTRPAEQRPPAPAKPAAKERPAAPERRPAAPQPAVAAGDRDETVAFTNIRRRTAEHMVRSKATSAHTLVAVEADFDRVERARRTHRQAWKEAEGFSLTYLPFVARAVIDAIEEFPHMNASVGDDELVVHRYVNLGIAVDLDFEGLVAPVIHDADGKRLRAIAREISDLAARARAKKLGPDDIAGGTFTITNPGPFGTFITSPIINQPQVAILSTDSVRKRPVVVEAADGSDAIAVHPVGMLALSFDHRAIDGAYASAFVSRVREIIETRDWDSEL